MPTLALALSSAGSGSGYGSVSALDGEGKAYRSDISTKSAPTSTSAQPSSSETASVDGAWTRDSYYTQDPPITVCS